MLSARQEATISLVGVPVPPAPRRESSHTSRVLQDLGKGQPSTSTRDTVCTLMLTNPVLALYGSRPRGVASQDYSTSSLAVRGTKKAARHRARREVLLRALREPVRQTAMTVLH